VTPAQTAERRAFLLALAKALHASGTATHRLEGALEDAAGRLGVVAQYFATPTSIFASFGSGDSQQTFMVRTVPQPTNLGRWVQVTEVARAVLGGSLDPSNGAERLNGLLTPPAPTPVTTAVGYMLASAAGARFLGGGGRECLMAAVAGLAIGVLSVVAQRLPNIGRVFELAAATLGSFGVAALGVALGGFSVPTTTLAGMIVLVPGLTLTTAIAELAYGHLTAGTTRMAGAFMTFISMGFGVALGGKIATALFGAIPTTGPGAAPPWTNWLALIASAFAFSILLRADRRDLAWIVVAGAVAFVATRLGSELLGPAIGVFVGALAIGLGSNLFNRISLRPAAVTLVPGLLTLVPGSTGFRSIAALLDNQVVAGIDTAFTMMLTAVSLVAGLLAAAAIYPERPLS
jgi:uncharacterized membrane protein YjjP (DUF1212 family)